MDPFRNQLNIYDPFRNIDMDPFRNFNRYQDQNLLNDEDVLRGTENSYVTKINYDKDGNPIKEVLQTKVFHANDKGQKIIEKEKRYINDKLGEEKISKEKILGDKAVKVVTVKSKNKPEETRTYLKGGLQDNQLDEFNREYDRVKNEIRQQQINQQQYRQLGQNQQQNQQQYQQLGQNQQNQQQYQQVDQNKNLQNQQQYKQIEQKKDVNQQQQQQQQQKQKTLHDEFESHHDEGYQLAQDKNQNINKNQQQQKKNL
jgi:hypothetical protein